MKKLLIIAALLVVVAVCLGIEGVYTYDKEGTKINPGVVHTVQNEWESAGTFAAAGAEPTTPDSTHRTYALMSAVSKVQVKTIKPGWNSIILRNSSTTDGDSTVYDVFLSRGTSDHFHRICTLTWTTGTQTAGTSGYEFADTLAETNVKWHKTSFVLSPTGNYIAEYSVDVMGCSQITFVPTTITNDAVLEITGF